MHNKGYIYTIVSLIFGVILLLLISLQYQSTKITTETEPSKIRTDELHYFVESTKKDLSRAMAISGRRAAIYLVDYMIYSDKPYTNATAALAELIINATIQNNTVHQNITHMRNHTINFWINKTREVGEEINFDVNMTPTSIEIYPYDYMHFLQIITINTTISDKKGATGRPTCKYENPNLRIYSIASIDGVEDPLYPQKTENKVRRHYNPQTSENPAQTIAFASNGSGMGGGEILDLRNITSNTQLNETIVNYSLDYPEKIPYTVFVINKTDYLTQVYSTARQVINQSGGLINEQNTNLDGLGFPYLAGVRNINYSHYKYIVIRNGLNHSLIYLGITEDIKNNTYYSSTEGASFFDRLEGRLNLTEKYVNLSRYGRQRIGVNTTQAIGLEGFVNVSEFAYYKLYENGILPEYTNQTATDYKYFANKAGQQIYGTPYWFRLDGKHINKYNITEYAYDPNYTGVWHFNEGGGDKAYDDTRKPSTATINGSTWVDGIQGTALKLNGVSDYILIPTSQQLSINNYREEYTISAWFKGTYIAGTNKVVISKNHPFIMFVNETGNLTCGIYTSVPAAGGQWMWLTGPKTEDNRWYYGACVWKKTEHRLSIYVNGSLINSRSDLTTIDSNIDGDIVIGREASENKWHFDGIIDEVKIYSRALSDYEIMEEYNKYINN